MKTITVIIILSTILFSCSAVQEEKPSVQNTAAFPIVTYVDSLPELTQAQEEALDALNTLQTSTDEMSRLYSTFANIYQPSYPADTSFVITQSQMLGFMKQFVSKHCQNLDENIQDELAKTSVLAQMEYTVFYCNKKPSGDYFKNGLPMSGTWVIPNLLGRRDVVMVW